MLQRLWDFGRGDGGGWEEEDTLLSPLGVGAGCYISSSIGTTLRLSPEDLLGHKFSKVDFFSMFTVCVDFYFYFYIFLFLYSLFSRSPGRHVTIF